MNAHVDIAGHRLRRRLELAVERLLAILDGLDGNADLEPSLGWPEDSQALPQTFPPAVPRPYPDDDREEEDEHGGDIHDEPHDWDEVELDDSEYDISAFIPGGQGA